MWSFHSIDDDRLIGVMMARCEVNASHNKKINIIKAINEIIEPIEETTFHVVNESG